MPSLALSTSLRSTPLRSGLGAYSPSLLLDFTNGNQTLDPRITFTRTTTATRTNASGLIESVAIDGPRFDYSPTTLAPLGLLIEEQRTNLILQSESFISPWTIASGFGSLTTGLLTESVSGTVTQASFNQIASFTTGVVYTGYFDVEYIDRQFVQLIFGAAGFGTESFGNFDLVNGVVGTKGTTTTSTSITQIGLNRFRIAITATATGTTTTAFQFNHVQSANAVRAPSITLTGKQTRLIRAQLEAGAFPTSYIPTVASQVTRAADVAVMTGTNFSSWYNAAEGSFFAEWIAGKDTSFINVFATGTTTIGESMSVRRGSSGNMAVAITNSGVVQANISLITGEPIAGTTFKTAVGYQVNNFAAALNGVIAGTDASGTVPLNISTLVMGSGWNSTTGSSAAEFLNGTIRRIAYYPRRLSSAELQGITS